MPTRQGLLSPSFRKYFTSAAARISAIRLLKTARLINTLPSDSQAAIPPQRRAFGTVPQRLMRNSLPAHNACVFLKNALGILGRHQKKVSPQAHRRMRMAIVCLPPTNSVV
jgi:hypothetical protein